jgi:hypothetical protein
MIVPIFKASSSTITAKMTNKTLGNCRSIECADWQIEANSGHKNMYRSFLQKLKKERDQLDHAIAALEGVSSYSHMVGRPRSSPRPSVKKKRGGVITAAGRKRLSEAMKKRWAEGRKKST